MRRTTASLLATWALLALGVALLPGPARASGSGKYPLQEVLPYTDLVLVGTVTAIDDSAGAKDDEALTRIDVRVERVMRGSYAKRGSDFTIYQRGGMRRDGSMVTWTNAPLLAVGDTYLMMLSSRFVVTPFIGELWRVVQAGNGRALVDGKGRTLGYSSTHGIMRGARVAQAISERARVAAGAAIRSSNGTAERASSEDIGSVQSSSADAEIVLAAVADLARGSLPTLHEMASGTKPLPLDFAPTPGTEASR